MEPRRGKKETHRRKQTAVEAAGRERGWPGDEDKQTSRGAPSQGGGETRAGLPESRGSRAPRARGVGRRPVARGSACSRPRAGVGVRRRGRAGRTAGSSRPPPQLRGGAAGAGGTRGGRGSGGPED